MNIMCYCILNYGNNLIFDIYYINLSCIIVFFTNLESVISWYFLSDFFEAVKELHKVWFPISINRNNLNFPFVGQQVRKSTCQCLSKINVKLHLSIIFPKITFNFSSQCQQVITRIGGWLWNMSVLLLFFWWIQIRVCTQSPSKNTNCF